MRVFRLLFAGTATLLAACSLLYAQGISYSGGQVQTSPGRVTVPGQPQSGQPPQGQEPKEPAKIEGRVTAAATGAPLKRANIMLLPAQPGPNFTPITTSTDADGKFAMAEIAPGQYRLSADKTGYVRAEFGARGANRLGATINLMPGQEMKQLNLTMIPHGVISGRVTDEDGEPIANVAVQTMMYRFMNGRRQLMPSSAGMTNDLGEYRIFGISPGRYFLSATARNMMGMMGSVDGTAGGRPAQPEFGYASTYYPGTNDPGAALQIAVAPGKPVTNVDLRLLQTPTVRVRGKIANAVPNPTVRVMVQLMPRTSAGVFMFDRNMTTARPDGKFEIRGVTPGSYNLVAQSFDGENRLMAKMPVEVGNGPLDGIEVNLARGDDLTGAIKLEGEAQVTLSTLRVYLEPKEMNPLGGGGTGLVQDNGEFRLKNVVPDTYRVRIIGGGQNAVFVKSVYVGEQEAKDGEISIVPGTSPALSVVVSTAGGQITGEVKGEKDVPAQAAAVVLVPDAAKREQFQLYKVATTDQSGKFTLTGIAPGSYKLFAWDNAEPGQWMDPDFLQPYENEGKSITVRESAKETADLKLLRNESAGEAGSAR